MSEVYKLFTKFYCLSFVKPNVLTLHQAEIQPDSDKLCNVY